MGNIWWKTEKTENVISKTFVSCFGSCEGYQGFCIAIAKQGARTLSPGGGGMEG